MKEASLVTYQQKVIDFNIGNETRVEFNFERIWNYKKFLELELAQSFKKAMFHPDFLHFIHVHPQNMLTYSELDIDCIRGLNIAFGFAVDFSIVTFNSTDVYDWSYNMISYNFVNQTMKQQLDLNIQKEHIIILKLLSLGL